MFSKYHMIKSEREMKDKEGMLKVLKNGKYIILSLSLADEPYILTLSYGLDEEKNSLYFHTALKGLKLRVIEENPKVCGTVIEDLGYAHGECSHKYRSIILYGRISQVLDLEEKKHGMMTMLKHLEENPIELRERFLKKDSTYDKVNILRLDIDEMTGKESS